MGKKNKRKLILTRLRSELERLLKREEEVKGGDFGLLAEAVFIPLVTLDEAMQKNRALLKCVFDDEEEIEHELERRMPRYVQTSEGVIWVKSKVDADRKGGC